ncbi:MAG: flippase-like domain-containing protein [Saprospiraceae bacterium]|nr:flippase-like domain-containing protein [Saprospiraceae bacterium]
MSQETATKKQNSLISILKFLLFISVGFIILYFVYQNQEAAYQLECTCKQERGESCAFDTLLDKIIHDFQNANFFWLGVVCLLFMISNISRALRWNQLIEPLGYQPKTFNTFFATMIGYMVNLALPRAGEIAKPAAVTRYEKIPLDKLLGTIFTDRVFDILMLLIVVLITFIFQFQYLWDFLFGEGITQGDAPKCSAVESGEGLPWLWILGGMAAAGFLGLLIIAWKWKVIKETAIAKKIIGLLMNLLEGVKTVFKLRRPGMFIFHTLVIWLMYYLMLYVCFFAYEPTAKLFATSPEVALLAFTFGTFGMLIPSPGGMGTYQLAVTMALTIHGMDDSDAFAFANIMFFTITIFCNVIFGFLAYILLPIYNKNYDPQPATTPEDSK